MKKNITIPFFIPHRGCPHQCVFCNQHSITGESNQISTELINQRVMEYVADKDLVAQIGFFGGTFTALPLEEQETYLKAACNLKKSGHIHSIRLSTRPDSVSDIICNMLKHYGVDTVEIGVQSFDNDVLYSSERGHSREDSINALKLLRKYGFRTGIQLMPGLPSSTYQSDIESAKTAAKLNPDDLRIYPTVVIKNTRLAWLYQQGLYTPLSLEQAINICAQIYAIFEPLSTKIIRIGLHALSDAESVISGPYHTAFGFLVKSRFYRNIMEAKLPSSSNENIKFSAELPAQNYEEYIGNKKDNILYLEKKYNIRINYHRGTNLRFEPVSL
ncbi:MAG TPA: radical SAM protein [Spirochaetota bacterium]|nr:radical SAM protein [Spirochaetota bacterium]